MTRRGGSWGFPAGWAGRLAFALLAFSVLPTLAQAAELELVIRSQTTAELRLKDHSGQWSVRSSVSQQCLVVDIGHYVRMSGLKKGTKYTYDAYAGHGCWSNKPIIASVTFTTLAPLAASGVTHNAATLTISNWNNPWRYKRTSPAGGTCSSQISGGTKTAGLTGLTGNTSYAYMAYNDSNCSVAGEQTEEVRFLTKPSRPARPTAINGVGSGKLKLTSSVTGGSGALTKWQYTTDDGVSWEDILVTSTTLSHTVSGLTNGTSYNFKVRAVNATGPGPVSDASTAVAPTAVRLAASAVTHDSATLTIQNHSSDWYYTANTGPDTSCSNNAVTGTTKNLTNLRGNTSYSYKSYGDSNCSTELVSVAFLTKPGKPTKPVAATGAGSGKLTLTSSVTGNGTLSKWQYQRKQTSDSNFGSWEDIASTSTSLNHTVTGLTDGTYYQFKVRVVNATGGSVASDASEPVAPASATPYTHSGLQVPGKQVTSAAPTLAASAVTDTTATLTISNHSGNWYYQANTAPHASCSSSAVTGSTVNLASLTPGTGYTYRAYSDSDCRTELATAASFPTLPPKPSTPTVTAGVSSGQFSLSATVGGGSAAITGWQYKKKDSAWDNDWTDINETSKTLSYTVTGLTNGTVYRFRVRAVNAVGPGAASSASAPATPGTTGSDRLVRVNESTAPELSRAIASSAVRAVTGRIGQAASGETENALISLAHVLGTHGESWTEGTVSWGEALHGASFAHTFSAADGDSAPGGVGLWGAGDWRSLSGGEGPVNWDGSVGVVHLGTDAWLGRKLLGGLAVSLAEGSFDYSDRGGETTVSGTQETRMTGLSPYAGLLLADGSRLWAMLGYGTGELETDDGEAGRQLADSGLRTVAAGGSVALRSSAGSGDSPAALSIEGDVMLSRFEIEDNGNRIRGVEADAHRMRIALKGARTIGTESGGTLTPSVELGMRWDGGDGATGAGLELGGGLAWAAPDRGIRMEMTGRKLVAHQGDLEEWGVGGAVGVDPGADGLGGSLDVGLSLGETDHGVGDLWQAGMAGRGPEGDGSPVRLVAEGGWGMAASGVHGGVLTPYVGMELVGGGDRSYRMGIRLGRGPAAWLSLEGSSAYGVSGTQEHALTLHVRAHW